MILKQKLKRGIIFTLTTIFLLSFFSFQKAEAAIDYGERVLKTTCTVVGSEISKQYSCSFTKYSNSPNAKYQVIAFNASGLQSSSQTPKGDNAVSQSPVSSSSPISFLAATDDYIYLKSGDKEPYIKVIGDINPDDLKPATAEKPAVVLGPPEAPVSGRTAACQAKPPSTVVPKLTLVPGSATAYGAQYTICAQDEAQKKAITNATGNVTIILHGSSTNPEVAGQTEQCITDETATQQMPISSFDSNGCLKLPVYGGVGSGSSPVTTRGPYLCRAEAVKPVIQLSKPDVILCDSAFSNGSASSGGDAKDIPATCVETVITSPTKAYKYSCTWDADPSDKSLVYTLRGKQKDNNGNITGVELDLCQTTGLGSCNFTIDQDSVSLSRAFPALLPVSLGSVHVVYGNPVAPPGGGIAGESEQWKCPADFDQREFNVMNIFNAKGGMITNSVCFLFRGILGIDEKLRNWIGPKITGKNADGSILKDNKGDPINGVINVQVDTSGIVGQMWGKIKNFINSIFVISFLIMALFAAIGPLIKFKMYDSWKVQKMLPTIVATVFLVNFSFAIINFFINIATIVSNAFDIGGMKESLTSVACMNLLYALIITIIVTIFSALIVYFYIILWVRFIVINVLAVFCAVPYIGNILPFKQVTDLTGKFWEQFSKWLTMGPLLAIFLYLTSMAIGATQEFNKIDPGIDTSPLNESTCKAAGESLSILQFIIAIAIMYIGISFSLKYTAEAGKIVKSAVDYASGKKGGKINPMTYARKKAEAGVKRHTENLKGWGSTKIKEMATKSQEGKGGILGAAANAVLLNKARKDAKDKGIKRRLESSQKGYDKAIEDDPFIRGQSAFTDAELSDKNEKVEAMADKNVERDVDSIKRDLAEEMRKGPKANKQKLNAYASALQKISNGYGSGSFSKDPKGEMKKQAADLMAELNSRGAGDLTKVDANLASNLSTFGGNSANASYLNDMQRGKFQGGEQNIINDLANTPSSSISESQLAKLENDMLPKLNNDLSNEGIKKELGVDITSMSRSDGTAFLAAIESGNYTDAQRLAGSTAIDSAKFTNLHNSSRALETLNDRIATKQVDYANREETMVGGWMEEAKNNGTTTNTQTRLVNQTRKIETLINDGDIEGAQKLSKSVFGLSVTDPSTISQKEMTDRLEARIKAFRTHGITY